MLMLLPLLAAVLRGLALPGWWLPPEVVLLVIPLRIAYWERGGRAYGDYLGGILHVAIYFHFLHNALPFATIPVALVLGLWWLGERALYFGLRHWVPYGLAGAFAVTAVEWFRFHWPMGGVPWGSLALGLADRPIALRWANVLGESGWVVLVALVGAGLWSLWTRRKLAQLLPAPVLVVVVLVALGPPAPRIGTLHTLSVQGNLGIEEKHGGGKGWSLAEVYQRQAKLTRIGLDAVPGTEMVLWSETMYPIPVTPAEGAPGADGFMIRPWSRREEQIPTETLRALNARNIRALLGDPDARRTFITGGHLYLGVPAKSPWREGEPREPWTWSPRSSEILAFDQEGRLEDHFSKSELVPFGERLPFDGKFPGGESVAIAMLRFTKLFPRFADSDREGPLTTRGHVLGGAVCWENVFERTFRRQADRGAEAFLILSNENWYGISAEMDQMIAATRFRAVETGRPILRVANTGVTALFDGKGNVLSELPRGMRGYFRADLPLIEGSFRTPYQRYGWLLQPVIAWLGLIGGLAGWMSRAKRPRILRAPAKESASDRKST